MKPKKPRTTWFDAPDLLEELARRGCPHEPIIQIAGWMAGQMEAQIAAVEPVIQQFQAAFALMKENDHAEAGEANRG